jgi:hypothetical protein
MHRRSVMKLAVGVAMLAAPHIAQAQRERTLRFVPVQALSVLDPVFSGARATHIHAYLVFDTLYDLDRTFTAREQMVEGHSIEEGVSHVVDYQAGDTRSLDLAAASFDAVLPHTLVSHVDDPAAVMEKPLASSSLVAWLSSSTAIMDRWRSAPTIQQIGTHDPAEGMTMDAAIIASVSASPRVMRSMPYLLRTAGLTLEASMAHVLAEIGQADYWAGMLNSLPVLLPKAGLVDEDTARAFVAAQHEASANGTFFCSANFYTYIARRPM